MTTLFAPGDFARSIESHWLGRVEAIEGSGLDTMLRMQGVNSLTRAIAGGDISEHIDADDVQWFSPDDVRKIKFYESAVAHD